MQVVHDYTVEHGAYPSPLRYHHFPKSVCTSVNEVICHGIPDMRELQSGDIVNVDVSCLLDGAHGDLNETFLVGEVDSHSKQLVKVSTYFKHAEKNSNLMLILKDTSSVTFLQPGYLCSGTLDQAVKSSSCFDVLQSMDAQV